MFPLQPGAPIGSGVSALAPPAANIGAPPTTSTKTAARARLEKAFVMLCSAFRRCWSDYSSRKLILEKDAGQDSIASFARAHHLKDISIAYIRASDLANCSVVYGRRRGSALGSDE